MFSKILNDNFKSIINDIKTNKKYDYLKEYVNEYYYLYDEIKSIVSNNTETLNENIQELTQSINTKQKQLLSYINEMDNVQLLSNTQNIKTEPQHFWIYPSFNQTLSNSDKLIINTIYHNVFDSIEELNIYKIKHRKLVLNELKSLHKYNKEELKKLHTLNNDINDLTSLKNKLLDLLKNERLKLSQNDDYYTTKIKYNDNAIVLDYIVKIKEYKQSIIKKQKCIDVIKRNKKEVKNSINNNCKKETNKILINNSLLFNSFINNIQSKIYNDRIKQLDMCKKNISLLNTTINELNIKIDIKKKEIQCPTKKNQNLINYYTNTLFQLERKIIKIYNNLN